MSKNVIFDCCRNLVDMFCPETKNWAREMKIARQLLWICQDMDAWEALVLPRKINSLSYFLTEDGRIFIPTSIKNPYLLDIDKLAPKSKNKNKVDL